jgi:hypothetical protein
MAVPRIFEKLFMWSLLAALICVVSFAIIRYVTWRSRPPRKTKFRGRR